MDERLQKIKEFLDKRDMQRRNTQKAIQFTESLMHTKPARNNDDKNEIDLLAVGPKNEAKEQEEQKKQTQPIVLSSEQEDALDAIKAFITAPYDNEKPSLLLTGYAGTGKSLIISYLISWMERRGMKAVIPGDRSLYASGGESLRRFALCAPTHKAKYVVTKYTGCEAMTIHQLLNLRPTLDIMELDYSDLKFVVENIEGNPKLKKNMVIIIDECSMINSGLYKSLMDISYLKSAKFIFIGDPCQLMPVKEEGLSPVFNKPTIKLELTKVFRQNEGNAIMPILLKLRTEPMKAEEFETKRGEKGSLIVYSDLTEFMRSYIAPLRESMEKADTDMVKLFCYRNKKVHAYNEVTRKCLFKQDAAKPFHKNEFIMGYENIKYGGYDFFNSSDYIITNEPELIDVVIPQIGKVKGWGVVLYDKVGKQETLVPMIEPDKLPEGILYEWMSMIESVRLDAIECKKYGKRQELWRQYFELFQCCAVTKPLVYQARVIKPKSFDYGYACTVHKSQGSGYMITNVDMSDILLDDNQMELRQLQYVALSRTRSDCNILLR